MRFRYLAGLQFFKRTSKEQVSVERVRQLSKFDSWFLACVPPEWNICISRIWYSPFIRRLGRSGKLPLAYLARVSHSVHSVYLSSSRPSMMCPLFLNPGSEARGSPVFHSNLPCYSVPSASLIEFFGIQRP